MNHSFISITLYLVVENIRKEMVPEKTESKEKQKKFASLTLNHLFMDSST